MNFVTPTSLRAVKKEAITVNNEPSTEAGSSSMHRFASTRERTMTIRFPHQEAPEALSNCADCGTSYFKVKDEYSKKFEIIHTANHLKPFV